MWGLTTVSTSMFWRGFASARARKLASSTNITSQSKPGK
jgi:hypothetical protein